MIFFFRVDYSIYDIFLGGVTSTETVSTLSRLSTFRGRYRSTTPSSLPPFYDAIESPSVLRRHRVSLALHFVIRNENGLNVPIATTFIFKPPSPLVPMQQPPVGSRVAPSTESLVRRSTRVARTVASDVGCTQLDCEVIYIIFADPIVCETA